MGGLAFMSPHSIGDARKGPTFGLSDILNMGGGGGGVRAGFRV